MNGKIRSAFLFLALSGASAVFASTILPHKEPRTAPVAPATAPTEETVSPLVFSPAVQPSLEALVAALDRPLFTQSRRPSAPPAAPAAELGATLTGVLTTDVEKVALVRPVDAKRAVRLREGDEYRGWRVLRIEQQALVFEQAGRTERLVLSFTGAKRQ